MQGAGATLEAVHEEHVVEHAMNADAHEDFGSGFERTFVGLLAIATALMLVYLTVQGTLVRNVITYKTAAVINNPLAGQDLVNLGLMAPILAVGGAGLLARRAFAKHLLIATPLFLIYYALSYTIGWEWSSPAYTGNSQLCTFYFLFVLVAALIMLLYSLAVFRRNVTAHFAKAGLAVFSALALVTAVGYVYVRRNFSAPCGSAQATMGETLPVVLKKGTGDPIKITIRFRKPAYDNNDPVFLDHIDLIAGQVTGRVAPGSSGYNDATNRTTRVMATFGAGDWEDEGDGWHVIQYHVRLDKDMYFRLRGTNLAPNTPNETDEDGNPLADSLMGGNTAAKAWADLWFYSNPIVVRVRR